MATKSTKSAGKSKPSSNRGGARAGAGRKPKPVEDIRQALNTALISEVVAGVVGPVKALADHATAAMETLRTLMDSDEVKPVDRIAAAKELLNRTIGRAREEAAPVEAGEETEQVHIYLPSNDREAM